MQPKYKKIKFFDIKSKKLIINDSHLIIYTPILSLSSLTNIALIILFFWALVKGGTPIFFLGILALIFSFYRLLIIFQPVKTIRINRIENYFILSSRNPIVLL